MMPDHGVQDLFGTDLPIVQAPMTGPTAVNLVAAVSEAGGSRLFARGESRTVGKPWRTASKRRIL